MISDRRLANLQPVQKGQSGNPSGRRKTPKDVKELTRGLTKEACHTRPIRRTPTEICMTGVTTAAVACTAEAIGSAERSIGLYQFRMAAIAECFVSFGT